MKGIEKEEKLFVKQFIAEYISYRINLRYLRYRNKIKDSYRQLYNSSFDQLIFSQKEQEEIYREVDRILEEKYHFIFAHNDKEKPIYLVNLNETPNDEGYQK